MRLKIASLALALLLLPAVAPAQQKGGVELTAKAEVEVVQKAANGEKVVQRVDASKANVLPGDTVIYTVGYLNSGEEPAANVVITNPVPEHMTYLDNSAGGAGTRIDFSIDKGKSYAPLQAITVQLADGKERPARAAEVTTIRWTLEKPIPAGGKGAVFFRCKVQ